MKQTRFQSLFESLNAAAFAAPTALLLHKLTIIIAGDCAHADFECNNLYISITWFSFFLHSIVWKYFVRRIHDKYGIKLDPIYLFKTYILKKIICKYEQINVWRSRYCSKNR